MNISPLPVREPAKPLGILTRRYTMPDGSLLDIDTMVVPRDVWRRLPEAREPKWHAGPVDGHPDLVHAIRLLM